MSVGENLRALKTQLPPDVTLVAVTKTHGVEKIMEAYEAGHRDFGENRVQELLPKAEALPKDIRWHLIGHLQSNKVKYIAPFIHLIHSVDSPSLLAEISKQAQRYGRDISFLVQMHIAKEDSKFGATEALANEMVSDWKKGMYPNTRLQGAMGMATLTDDLRLVKSEFEFLHQRFVQWKQESPECSILSMGMSSDWKLALECGSNMIRVGSLIFGER